MCGVDWILARKNLTCTEEKSAAPVYKKEYLMEEVGNKEGRQSGVPERVVYRGENGARAENTRGKVGVGGKRARGEERGRGKKGALTFAEQGEGCRACQKRRGEKTE